MPTESTAVYQLVFAADGIEPGAVLVTGVTCSEGMSRLYSIDVDLEAPVADFDPRPLVWKSAAVIVGDAASGAVVRRYLGVVTRVRLRAGHPDEGTRFSLTIEPTLAVLGFSTDHRIFQEKTTPEIVQTLLDEAGLDAATLSFRLSGSYPTREVCTQFGETNLAFASRILEEDGIFYFFEHTEEGTKLVFGDSASAYAATSPDHEIPFRPQSGLASRQAILRLSERERLRPVKVTLRDHDFKRPALDLEATAQGSAPLDREHYDYPGRYVDPAEGQRRARLRVEAMDTDASRVAGESNVFSLTPGHTFELTEAPDAGLEREWVVVEVTHRWLTQGTAVSFSNRFEALPSATAYRPLPRTPRAVVRGVQLARVMGPSGEEIHCDEFGRIKVHFFWDRRSTRDDESSAWVRVGQMHTSGSVAIPRVGWEVLVEFEDGDPDRPIVVGRVYNRTLQPPYALPKEKTTSSLKSRSSPGGGGHNEIRMDDSGGGEHFHVHAQKDLNLVVANNKTEKVATKAIHSVGVDHALTVGADETLHVDADHGLTVGASQTWSVGGSRTKTIGGGEAVTVTGARSLSIGGSHTTMTPMVVAHSTPAALSETVGGSCVEAAGLGVSMAAAGVASITVGGSKIEAVATGKTDVTVGARASTVGGAFISASPADVAVKVGGVKATTVGGAWAANAASEIVLSSKSSLSINVGGAVAMNAASIAMKVGGSSVTLSAGQVVIKASQIKLTATGPQAELAPMVEDA